MIRIGIAEDQALVRESLAIVLDLEKDIEVVWKTETGAKAVQKMKNEPVDVVLMDLRMPDMDGVMATKHIISETSKVRVIVLTTFDHDEWILDAMHAGASCCFLKEISPKLLIEAIRLIYKDGFYPKDWSEEWRKYVPEIQIKARLGETGGMQPYKYSKKKSIEEETLTHRELEIFRRIGENWTNAEIAQTLFLTEGTVKNYVSNLYQKIGVRNRAEAIRYAKEKGII